MKEINSRIYDLRKHLGLSRRAFGEPLAASDSVIKNIENDSTDPKPAFIELICRTYNVNEQWLKTGEGEVFQEKSLDDEIIDAFGKLMMDDSNDFIKQFVVALAKLGPEEWKAIEKFAYSIVENRKETKKEDV